MNHFQITHWLGSGRLLLAACMLALCLGGVACSARIGVEPAPYLSVSSNGLPRATVTVSQLNVRSSPSSKAEVLEVLHQGDKVELVSQHDGWMEVRTPSRSLGWVSGNYLSGHDPSRVPYNAQP